MKFRWRPQAVAWTRRPQRAASAWMPAWGGGRWWASVGLLAVVTLHLLGGLPFQDTLRMQSFDLYQTVAPRVRESAPVVIVDIDEASLKRLGQWPWPRNLTAQLLDRIWQAEPAAVGLDILMPEPDRVSACEVTRRVPDVDPALVRQVCALPGNDSVLAEALRQGKTALGVAGVDGPSRNPPRAPPMRAIGGDPLGSMRRFDAALANLPELEEAVAGHAILSTDIQQGVVRRVPMVANVAGAAMPSLSLELLRLASGSAHFAVRSTGRRIEGVGVRDLFVPTQPDGSLWVHYGHHDEARFVSAAAVLDGSVDPAALNRKLVLVGLSGLGLVDHQSTALGERLPGVEIHAQVLESIFDGTTLLRPHWALWLEGGLMLLVGLAISWGFPRMRPRVLLPIVVVTLALLWAGGLAAFARAHLLIDVASPMSILVVMFCFMLADSLVREEMQRKALERDLQAQREQAAQARGEMEAARRIQMGILPDVQSAFAGEPRLDIAARMEPARLVGGDLFDCFMLDAHHVFFSVGDVCGKGVPASLFMAISKTLCKSLALRDERDNYDGRDGHDERDGQGGHDGRGAPDGLDPAAVMTRANIEISRDNPEMFFVTAFIGVLDLRTGELEFCNAGHDRPLVFQPGGEPVELDVTHGPPVCVMEDFEYASSRLQLAAGQCVCLFTDGVTEAFDPQQALYGRDRILEVLRTTGAADARARTILDALCDSVHAFADGAEPSDDLTAMVLRWTP